MADKVQLTLEALIPDLDALVQKGIFTKKDAKKITKKRRFHEYQFEKKDVSKVDFLKAIQYETVLNKRMEQQRKKLHIEKRDFNDSHFIRRIIVLYQKCLIKFEKDQTLWLDFFNFLIKNKCNKVLNKEIGKTLIKFPRNLIFWKIAGYNEFENNLNTKQARTLFLKCIRLNPIIDAYINYFVFEIKFAEKVSERRNLLLQNKNGEKLKMLDEIIEDKEEEIDYDEISKLTIPTLAWQNAIQELAPKTDEEMINLHYTFLENLIKYATSKYLDSSELEEKITNAIISLSNTIESKLRVILIKIKKIKNVTELFDTLYDYIASLIKETKENNYIIYECLSFIMNNYNNEKPQMEIFFSKIKPLIALPSLINTPKLISLLSSQDLQSENILDINTLYKFSFDIIQNGMTLSNSSATLESINEAFTSISNLKYQIENVDIITTLASLSIKNESLLSCYIENIIKLISQEISYYLDKEKAMNYFNSIIIQIEKVKDISYHSIKYLYENIIDALISSALLNSGNTEGYLDIILTMKKRMSSKLISFDECIKEIKQKRKYNEEQLSFINTINN